jgi:4a-hydroxytetrahydrobiopterin dehydratase
MKKLSAEEVKTQLPKLDGWYLENGKLCKDYTFKDFKQAFDYMTKLSSTINKLDHHPDWSNTYNKVSIKLSTHSVDGLTNTDFELAKAAEKLANQ